MVSNPTHAKERSKWLTSGLKNAFMSVDYYISASALAERQNDVESQKCASSAFRLSCVNAQAKWDDTNVS